MELQAKITAPKIDTNFEKVAAAFDAQLKKYEGMVYSVDDIKLAKEDCSELNKLSKQLNDERKRLEKEYNAPFIEFKNKVTDLKKRIDGLSGDIKVQLDKYDTMRKQQKEERIKILFDEQLEKFEDVPDNLKLALIFDPKWLNVSTSEKAIINSIQHRFLEIENDLKTLRLLKSEFEDQLIDKYFEDLNLPTTIEYKATLERGAELAKQQQEEVAPEPEEEPFPSVGSVKIPEREVSLPYDLSVRCTDTQLKLLKEFMEAHDIKYML